MTETTPEEIKPKTITPFRAICERVLDEWLFKQYPSTFRVHSPIPLALGTSKELTSQLPEGIGKNDFKSAMSWYCGRKDYLKAILKNTQRINLQGELVGEVTEFDKTSAKERLDNKDKKKTKPKEIKPVVEIPATPQLEAIAEPETIEPEPVKKTLSLKSKKTSTVPTEEVKPMTNTASQATAKGLKVTLVIDPASLPDIDTTGMKKAPISIFISNGEITATTEINAKSYRKALSSIQEYGVDGCNVIIQGSMKQYGVIDDAGLVVQPKKQANAE